MLSTRSARRDRKAYLSRLPGDQRDLRRGDEAQAAAVVERTVATFGKLGIARGTRRPRVEATGGDGLCAFG